MKTIILLILFTIGANAFAECDIYWGKSGVTFATVTDQAVEVGDGSSYPIRQQTVFSPDMRMIIAQTQLNNVFDSDGNLIASVTGGTINAADQTPIGKYEGCTDAQGALGAGVIIYYELHR